MLELAVVDVDRAHMQTYRLGILDAQTVDVQMAVDRSRGTTSTSHTSVNEFSRVRQLRGERCEGKASVSPMRRALRSLMPALRRPQPA
jgi:hypothetical protein